MPEKKREDTRQARATAQTRIEKDQAQGGAFVEAVESTRMPMVVTDPSIPDNPIIFANAAFLELCGYDREEVLGHNYHFLAGPGTDPDVRARINRAVKAEVDITEEVLLYTKEGREIWVSMFVSVMVENGAPVRHFSSLFDITDRVRAEQRVAELNAALENRVASRTRLLEETNARLQAEVDRGRRLQATLRDALEQGQALLEQKDVLIREVHHRTKNALTVATSLLQIQASKADAIETREALRTATARLSRITEVYALLDQREAPESINLASYLDQVGQHLLASHGEAERVQIDLDIADVVCASDTAIALGLVVTEAVTNAIKYAFPEGEQGLIRVSLRLQPDGFMQLRVVDNGVGISQERRKGAFGMDLIQLLARKVKGTAEFFSTPGEGMTVSVACPLGTAS